jgi:hypothetical protein
VAAVIVTVDALLATFVTEAVMPVGTVVVVLPAELVYQVTVPAVPAVTFAVVAAKVAEPALPLVIVPDWVPRLTVADPLEPPPDDAGLEHPNATRLPKTIKGSRMFFMR